MPSPRMTKCFKIDMRIRVQNRLRHMLVPQPRFVKQCRAAKMPCSAPSQTRHLSAIVIVQVF